MGRLGGSLQSQPEAGYIFMSSHFRSPDPLMKIWHFALSYPFDKTSSSLSCTNAELQSHTILFTLQHPYMIQMIHAVLVPPVPLCKPLYLLLLTLLPHPPLLTGLPIDCRFGTLRLAHGLAYLSCCLILLLGKLLISEEETRVVPMAAQLPCLGQVCFV